MLKIKIKSKVKTKRVFYRVYYGETNKIYGDIYDIFNFIFSAITSYPYTQHELSHTISSLEDGKRSEPFSLYYFDWGGEGGQSEYFSVKKIVQV